jgi:hypothetical protein
MKRSSATVYDVQVTSENESDIGYVAIDPDVEAHITVYQPVKYPVARAT